VLQMTGGRALSNGDCLGAIRGPQLLHDVLGVYFHGFFRNEELFGDVAIPVRQRPVFDAPH
jgi:hypothetical protein